MTPHRPRRRRSSGVSVPGPACQSRCRETLPARQACVSSQAATCKDSFQVRFEANEVFTAFDRERSQGSRRNVNVTGTIELLGEWCVQRSETNNRGIMKSIIVTDPDFQSLPKGIKRLLVASESFFFREPGPRPAHQGLVQSPQKQQFGRNPEVISADRFRHSTQPGGSKWNKRGREGFSGAATSFSE
jgi:hypothetical protein